MLEHVYYVKVMNALCQMSKRRPGQSSQDRSLGSADDKVPRRLHTVDNTDTNKDQQGETQVCYFLLSWAQE